MTALEPDLTLELLWPLCEAAVAGDVDSVRDLLQQRADANLGTPYDARTPLHLAAASGQLGVVEFLVKEAGAELRRDNYGMLAVHDANLSGNSEVRAFLQAVDFKTPSLTEGHAFKEQMEKVFSLAFRDGIFSYHLLQAEVQYYYGGLGLHPVYFENFTAVQISRHIQSLIAAKQVADTRREREVELALSDNNQGFFLATLAPSAKHSDSSALCAAYLEETVNQSLAYSLTFMASDGSAFAKHSSEGRIGIYIVDRAVWPADVDDELHDETDLVRIATTSFMERHSPESLAMHKRLIEKAVLTRSTAVEVYPGSAFPGPYTGGYVIMLAIYEVGGRSARPLFSDLEELLWHMRLQPKRFYGDVFANGASTYTLFFPDASEANLAELQASMRFIQFIKRVPGYSGLLWNQVTAGAITPEQYAYMFAGVRFCLSFFPRERYVPQYQELQAALDEPDNKQKLDELYLQTIREVITLERIYDILSRHIALAPKFFADFKKIATGQVKAFWNQDLADEIDEKVPNVLAVQVLRVFLLFNSSIRITNFFKTDQPPSSIAFRLDPGSVLAGRPKTLFPDVPYGIFFVVGRDFHGFHVRFREIARGGVRLLRSRDRAVYMHNASTLFEECYGLAFTQQLKNKDIPEGGSKGVILPEAPGSGTPGAQSVPAGKQCFVKYLDAILDCMLLPAGVLSQLENEELIFFGPDENTADCMDIGAGRARQRGHRFWKAMTTGKSVELGGVPHDVYGITTRGVRTYVEELLKALNLDETTITKLQTGGPDGDLGSNEILQSKDRTIAVLDAGAIAYDPAGLNRPELERLAKARQQISAFDKSKIGEGGFLVFVEDKDVTLPDGSQWKTGFELRDRFVFTKYARADLFVPCGGRPATVSASNVKQLLSGGSPPWRMVVEGANLFFTEDARRRLEEAGVHLFKDSSANKGGVTSSSLEVLASLCMAPSDHNRLLTLPAGQTQLPDFYLKYVDAILRRIEENCRDEFKVIWEASTHQPEGDDAKPMLKIDASRRLSQEITQLQDHIAGAQLPEKLIRNVLPLAIPKLLVDHCTVDGLMESLPPAYVKASVAFWLASRYVYEHGVLRSNSFAFHSFMRRLTAA